MKAFDLTAEQMSELVAVSRGDSQADLVLTNLRAFNVFSGETHSAEVAISNGRIAGVSREAGVYTSNYVLDLDGDLLAPGLIDAHVHLESSLLLPAEFANAVLPHGTTTVISDPHEIANVHGLEGIRFMLDASEDISLRVLVMLSSCVPATEMETSGARLSARDLAELAGHPRVLGIAEMMNYPGVAGGTPDMMQKAALGHLKGMRLDGHAPLVTGPVLQAYLAAGISSDHESVSAREALEKLGLGCHIFIRQGSTAKNLDALLPLVSDENERFCSFCTDDRQPEDLATEGHINFIVRRAIERGVSPISAVRMASLNTARHYGLSDLGAIAPGYIADLITVSDFEQFKVTRTFVAGKLVAEDGRMRTPVGNSTSAPMNHTHVAGLGPSSFKIPARGRRARVIGALPEQIITRELIFDVEPKNGFIEADSTRDILKIAVIERHKGTGNVGLGLLNGFGLRDGALASSVAHDSHNVVVVGTNDIDMLAAAAEVIRMGGGIVCAAQGRVIAKLALPVAGLMSDRTRDEVRADMRRLLDAAAALGYQHSNPYMAMAFLALPVIPELKLTDMGLVKVSDFSIVSLFAD